MNTPFAFRLRDVGRAALSVKGARQFRENRKRKNTNKIPVRPLRADL